MPDQLHPGDLNVKNTLLLVTLGVTAALSSGAFAGTTDEQELVAKRARLAAQAEAAALAPVIQDKGKRSGPVILDIEAYGGTNVGGTPWTRPFADGSCCSGLGPVLFTTQVFSVSANDSCSINSVQPGWDGYIFVYQNTFDPLNQSANYVAGNDDGGGGIGTSDLAGVPLNAGTTYILVTTGFEAGEVGNFTNTINCPVANVSLAGAGIELTSAGSNTPVPVAEELILPPERTLDNPSGRLNLRSEVGYAFSSGEVRYARLHCPGAEFTSASVVDFTGDPSNTVGAINGVGSDAIYFSITAGATPVVATDAFTVDGTRSVSSDADVDCTYGLYDFPSQAQAGGPIGRVATTAGAYLRFNPSYALVVDSQGGGEADVESADPAYSEFVNGSPTFSTTRAQIGGFSYGTVQDVAGDDQPITLDGLVIELADLMGANTTLTFSGDFEAASDVFFSPNANCAVNIQSADDFDAFEANFVIGSNPTLDHFLCYEAGGDPIRAGDYTVTLAPVSADPAVYAVANRGPLALGEITRNGAELQAPLAQVPDGYITRMVLTNTGSQAREYVIEVLGETGNVISTSNLTGTVPASGTVVVDLTTVLTGFTQAPRATLNVTVSGPNAQIQGLYQIVNQGTGSVSNHVMVRPGLN